MQTDPIAATALLPVPPPRSGLPPELAAYRLLNSEEAAQILGLPLATLRTWRSRRPGFGPPAALIAGRVRYRLSDLLEWVARHVETDTGEAPEGVEHQRGKARPPPEEPKFATRKRRP